MWSRRNTAGVDNDTARNVDMGQNNRMGRDCGSVQKKEKYHYYFLMAKKTCVKQ